MRNATSDEISAIIDAAAACREIIETLAVEYPDHPNAIRMSVLDHVVAGVIATVVAEGGNDRGRVFRLHEKHTRDLIGALAKRMGL